MVPTIKLRNYAQFYNENICLKLTGAKMRKYQEMNKYDNSTMTTLKCPLCLIIHKLSEMSMILAFYSWFNTKSAFLHL